MKVALFTRHFFVCLPFVLSTRAQYDIWSWDILALLRMIPDLGQHFSQFTFLDCATFQCCENDMPGQKLFEKTTMD
jgi:hypothetical protein